MPIVIVDTETTGLPHDKDARVLDVSLVVLGDELELIDAEQFYVRPSVWSKDYKKAEVLHKLTPVFIRDNGISEEEALLRLRAVCDKHKKSRWTSFNKPFDLGMLSRLGFNEEDEEECIMKMCARFLALDKKTISLKDAFARIIAPSGEHWDNAQHHTSSYDVYAATRLYTEVKRRGWSK